MDNVLLEWDGESYCITGCGLPAVASVVYGFMDESFITEMVCINHKEDIFYNAQ